MTVPFSALVLASCLAPIIGLNFLRQTSADEPRDEIKGPWNATCPPYQTPCQLGCCPFAQGVCCADGFECCQHGQTCVPFIGICIGLERGSGEEWSVVSSRPAALETPCPPGTTTCGPDKCCPYPDATCCEDGVHCCPHGYRCDLAHTRCVLDPVQGSFLETGVRKVTSTTCPGSDRVCPSYAACCIADDGHWTCCPRLFWGQA